MTYLLKCPECGKIYKCSGEVTVKGLQYITDYGDNVTETCIICKNKIKPQIIKTQDWIANLVFIVKGK